MTERSRPAHAAADGVAALFEPARDYRERVSRSSDAVKMAHSECGQLVQSLEPLKGLQGRSREAVESIRTGLADLTMSLEAAKGLHRQLSELVEMLDTGSELETQFHELSRALSTVLSRSGS
jgi:hypothetical protein